MKKAMIIYIFLAFFASAYVNGQFSQRPLPYDFAALEPYIDARTMEIHYAKHHAAYVNNLNKAIAGTALEKMSLVEIFANISQYDDAVRNNGGGHYNHELFWSVLTPLKNTSPSQELSNAVSSAFGDMAGLRMVLNNEARTRFGSGWAWLYLTPDGTLAVCSTPNQDNPLMDICEFRGIPILGIDVWEHAYYLKYQNKRGDYLEAIWNVINWDEVSRRYEKADGR